MKSTVLESAGEVIRDDSIKRHYELFLLLQGEVQHFNPHQVLISAWGDFGGPNLNLDVISAIPGVRNSDGEALYSLPNDVTLRIVMR